jgi:hypothetical protein
LEVWVRLEDKLIGNNVDIFGIAEIVDIEQVFKTKLIFFIKERLKRTVLKSSSPVVLNDLSFDCRCFLSWLQILLKVCNFFSLWCSTLNNLCCLS